MTRAPALFIGHGSPMNAIEDTPSARGWAEIARAFPKPRAIVVISAHWVTEGVRVTSNAQPRTIHDFGRGFPQALFDVQYPAPGEPALARTIVEKLTAYDAQLDDTWGLDHGTWSVVKHMYPDADVPIVQVSLDLRRPATEHYAIARALSDLRDDNVLILGSGNIVHNLRQISWEGKPYAWAEEFDAVAAKLIESRDVTALAHYEKLGTAAGLSIPTNEHYLPMLYTLAMQDAKDELSFFNTGIDHGSISMRSFILK